MVIVAWTRFLPIHPVLGEDRLELLGDGLRHLLVGPLPRDEDPARVVQDGEAAAPEHEGIVGVWPGDQTPVLRLTNEEARYNGHQPIRGQYLMCHLRGERGVSVVVVHHPGGGHRHIGDGHDHVSDTLVSRAPAVGHLGTTRDQSLIN